MTNEEAIAIIRKEYLCVDRDCDIERGCGKCDLAMPSKEPILEAYNMAIKALETIPKYKDAYNKGWDDGAKAAYEHLKMCEEEQSGDLISRQAVLDMAYDMSEIDGEHFTEPCMVVDVEDIQKLPSINPQEPKTDVLDKIRAEIEQMNNIDYVEPITVDEVLQIIDKYKAESEVQHDTISVRQNDS